jgi:type VI secretion system VasD/TssJ family lipoprotein
MRKYFQALSLMFIVLFVCSCAGQPFLPPPQYTYEKGAIQLRLHADPQLNLYEGSPHTLVLCLYQLTEPNVFNQLITDREGLSKLLKCARFDPSVTSFHRVVIQPGKQITETLDRAEGTKYVGIVAGYYSFQREKMTRLFDIPVKIVKKGFIRRKKEQKPGPLNIYLYLGPDEI